VRRGGRRCELFSWPASAAGFFSHWKVMALSTGYDGRGWRSEASPLYFGRRCPADQRMCVLLICRSVVKVSLLLMPCSFSDAEVRLLACENFFLRDWRPTFSFDLEANSKSPLSVFLCRRLLTSPLAQIPAFKRNKSAPAWL